jgi:peptide methionine sulfoxide reductase msrA/msrB
MGFAHKIGKQALGGGCITCEILVKGAIMRVSTSLDRAKKGAWAGVVGVALFVGWIALSRAQEGPPPLAGGDRLVIDDFSAAENNAGPTTGWRSVAGPGIPAGQAGIEEYEGRTCLHLRGATPVANRAAVVQAGRSLAVRGRPLDAGAYAGIRLMVKGNGGIGALRLGTRDARNAGQYYQAEFPLTGQWQEVKLLFGSFMPVGLRQPLDVTTLMNVALVAGMRGAGVDLYLDDIALYRESNMKKLTPQEERVIVYKSTEAPFTGKYDKHFEKGVYTCKRCGTELFESSSKFASHCGWPSFDEQIPGRVKWQPDPDGRRTEIICATCGAHLGHVFLGEGYTEKNTRYCVNSISMDFIPAEQRTNRSSAVGAGSSLGMPAGRPAAESSANPSDERRGTSDDPAPKTERALFASGCFWGTEYYLQRAPGVISTTVGFTGGHVAHPTYKQVCTGQTGHAETVEVVYDPAKTSYEKLAKLFFETHDFTQWHRQGPDIGPQYRSAIFYLNDEQKQTAERLVRELRKMGYAVKTEVTRAGPFWPAEDYHQDYYNKTGKTPYCHIYRPIFPGSPSTMELAGQPRAEPSGATGRP